MMAWINTLAIGLKHGAGRRIGPGLIPDHFAVDDTSAGRTFAHPPAQRTRFPPQVTPDQQRHGGHGREYQKREHECRNKHRGTRHSRQYLAKQT